MSLQLGLVTWRLELSGTEKTQTCGAISSLLPNALAKIAFIQGDHSQFQTEAKTSDGFTGTEEDKQFI